MNEHEGLVQAALAEVRALRKTNFRDPDSHVLQLLGAFPRDQSVANLLWAALPSSAAVQDIADLLSLWSWRTDDNGSSIMRSVECWIDEGADAKKIAVALSLDAYPFIDHDVRIEKLHQTARRFPDLAKRCEEIASESIRLQTRGSNQSSPI